MPNLSDEAIMEVLKNSFNNEVRWFVEIIEDLRAQGKDYWEEFIPKIMADLGRAMREVEEAGVELPDDEAKLLKMFRTFIEDRFLAYCKANKEAEEQMDIIVYGDTMGFIKPYGSDGWVVLEPSDEPTEFDLYLRNKLVLAHEGGKPITLYGKHGRDFIIAWTESGIPPNTYFASDRWTAERYWHPSPTDVLVTVRVPLNSVVETAEGEYKTIRTVSPDEFKIISIS